MNKTLSIILASLSGVLVQARGSDLAFVALTNSGAQLNAVAVGNGSTTVAVGASSTSVASTHSESGLPWVTATLPTTGISLRTVIYANNRFIAAGSGNSIYESTNGGQSWVSVGKAFTDSSDVTGLAANGGNLVAVSSTVQIRKTPLGTTNWSNSTIVSAKLEGYRAVTPMGTNGFAVCGFAGGLRTSVNAGATWNVSVPIATGQPDLLGIVEGAGKLVAVGVGGKTMVSANGGTTWTVGTAGTSTLNAVVYTGSEFIAVGTNGTIQASTDGTSWAAKTSPTANNLLGVAFASSGSLQGTVIAVGANGTILVAGTNPPPAGVAHSESVVYGSPNPALTATNVNPSWETVDWYDTAGTTLLLKGSRSFTPTNVPVGSYLYYAQSRDNRTQWSASSNRVAVTLNITPRSLTITATAQSKVYGDALPFGAGWTNFTASGLQWVDRVDSVTLASPGTAPTNGVGGYEIKVSEAIGRVFNLANYTVTYTNGLLTVNPAPLGIAADAKSRIYGDPNPDFTGAVSGIKNSELFTLSFSTPATTNSAIGAYNIVPSVAGATLSNYTVSSLNGVLTVTPAALTITANSTNRNYGVVNPGFTGRISGRKNGEGINLTFTTPALTNTPVGTYDIVPKAEGATVGNYTVTPVKGILTINKADLIIAADNQTKFYGQTNVFGVGMTNKFTPTGLKNGEWIGSVTLICTGGAPTNTVGTYPIEISGATGGTADLTNNYAVSYTNGVLTVNPALLTIKADNQSKEYGQVMTFMQSVTNNWTAAGLVNGETIGSVTLTCYGGPAISGARDWPITPSGATNGTASLTNYAVSYPLGKLTVRPALITIIVESKNRIYGVANPTLTGSMSATKNGDNLTVSYNTSATTSSPVGSYDIVPSLMGEKATNYTATAVNGNLTVSPAPLTITAADQSKAYGQTLLFGPGSTAFRADGLQNGEIIGSVTLACAGGVATNSPGTYTISISNAIGGTANLANYTPTYLPGALTVELSRLQLSIRAAGTNLIVSGVGAAGLPYRVDISSDLAAWVPWSTNSTGPNGTFELIDPAAAKRFYRAIQVNP